MTFPAGSGAQLMPLKTMHRRPTAISALPPRLKVSRNLAYFDTLSRSYLHGYEPSLWRTAKHPLKILV